MQRFHGLFLQAFCFVTAGVLAVAAFGVVGLHPVAFAQERPDAGLQVSTMQYGGDLTADADVDGEGYLVSGDWEYELDAAGEACLKAYTGAGPVMRFPSELDGHVVTKASGNDDDNYFFSKCDAGAIEEIDVPATMKSFRFSTEGGEVGPGYGYADGPNWFFCLPGVKRFVVDGGNPSYSSKGGVLFNADGTKLLAYPRAAVRTSYKIPASVSVVTTYAFYGNERLKKVSGGQNVKTFQQRAFDGMSALSAVVVGAKAKKLGNAVFTDCAAVKKVTVKSKHLASKTARGFLRDVRGNLTVLVDVGSNKANVKYANKYKALFAKSYSHAKGKVTVKPVKRAS